MTSLRIGVLIIGSLLWETNTHCRKAWREDRLDMSNRKLVQTHTRYGRVSESRSRQYTMVFSPSAASSTAFVVPCRATVTSASAFFEEAEQLAGREGYGTGSRWPVWGTVAVLASPTFDSSGLADDWMQYFQGRVHSDCEVLTRHGPGEAPSVNRNGFLQVGWPKGITSEVVSECDAILATANAPRPWTTARYATPQQIAEACVDAGRADYFRNNLLAGIRTADDFEIWRHIKERYPEWASSAEYRDVDTTFCL